MSNIADIESLSHWRRERPDADRPDRHDVLGVAHAGTGGTVQGPCLCVETDKVYGVVLHTCGMLPPF